MQTTAPPRECMETTAEPPNKRIASTFIIKVRCIEVYGLVSGAKCHLWTTRNCSLVTGSVHSYMPPELLCIYRHAFCIQAYAMCMCIQYTLCVHHVYTVWAYTLYTDVEYHVYMHVLYCTGTTCTVSVQACTVCRHMH